MQVMKWIYSKEGTQKYRSCHDLEKGMIIYSDGIQHCCHLGNRIIRSDRLLYSDYDEIDQLMEAFIEQKKHIIERNKKGKMTMCTDCKQLKEGYWSEIKTIQNINLSLDSVCNLRCSYCYKMIDLLEQISGVSVLGMIKWFKSNPYVDIHYPILYSSGEIAIQPEVDSILRALSDYDVCFFSNATRYNLQLNNMIKRDNNYLVVSLDCGTKETYKNIKGVDLFEEVCKNIKEYTINGGNVVLKYIVLKENSNNKDINEFINLCIENNINMIQISTDFGEQEKSSQIIVAATKLMRKAQKSNIRYFTQGVYELYNAINGIDYNYI